MILDSSAVVAIIRDEPEAHGFSEAIAAAATVAVSTATVLELSIVLGPLRQQVLDDFLATMRVALVPVDGDQLTVARRAHIAYGRGSGSRARLNYGDCFSYALAKSTGEPLLFKGDDFVHTDVVPAFTG